MVSVEVLRSFPYFAGVSNESLRAVAEIAEEREIRAGEALFREGDPADWLYILQDGEVDISYNLPDGQNRVVDTVVGGELMGWSAVVAPYQSTATGIAKKPGRTLRIKATGIRALCERHPVLGYRHMAQITRVLSSRLHGARVQLAVSG